jgi:hypothetical protein
MERTASADQGQTGQLSSGSLQQTLLPPFGSALPLEGLVTAKLCEMAIRSHSGIFQAPRT